MVFRVFIFEEEFGILLDLCFDGCLESGTLGNEMVLGPTIEACPFIPGLLFGFSL